MEFLESVTHIIKQDTFILNNTYTDVISEILFKITTTVNSIDYSEERILYLDWTKEHGDTYTPYGDVTPEQLIDWARARLTEQEISNMKDNIIAKVNFHGKTPISV